jgi:hypothetical protein
MNRPATPQRDVRFFSKNLWFKGSGITGSPRPRHLAQTHKRMWQMDARRDVVTRGQPPNKIKFERRFHDAL